MEIEKMALAFKALSNPKRLELFLKVYQWGRLESANESECCCEPVHKAFTRAAECMDLSRSTISHHIKELQHAGLITCNRDGQTQNCLINEKMLNEMKSILG